MERVEFSRPADLPGTEVLLADNCARRWRVFHHTYTVCTGLAIPRPAEWKYRNKIHLQDGDGVQLIEPGEFHENLKVTDPASFRALLVHPSVVEQAALELGQRSPPHLKVAQLHDRAPLWWAFAGLHASLERDSTPLERQSRFAACLRLLLTQCTENGGPPPDAGTDSPAVQRARAFIHEHVADRIGLEELAAAAGSVSRFHLVHAFTAAVGLPPHAYQNQLRLIQARALLAAGVPLAQAASEVGFADQSHLNRHFSRVVGVTPGAYARAMADRPALQSVALPEAGPHLRGPEDRKNVQDASAREGQ